MGSNGSSNCKDKIWDAKGVELYSYPYPTEESGVREISPYVQEHIDLVTCIRENIAVNEAEQTAITNMCAIMGRVSAYTGKEVTFDEMMNSDMKLGPDTYIMGEVGMVDNVTVPVPGEAAE